MSVSKVYIGNLAEDARDRDIEKLFKGYGRVRNIVVKHEGGYGFAEFDDREDAKDAVKDLDGTSFMGSRLRIEHARDSRDSRRDGGRWSPPRGRFSRGNPPGRRTGYRTIVENLSSRTSWQDLVALANCTVNFLLYSLMSRQFRITFRKTFHLREARKGSDASLARDKKGSPSQLPPKAEYSMVPLQGVLTREGYRTNATSFKVEQTVL